MPSTSPRSDKMAFCSPKSIEPIAVLYKPRWLVDLFPEQYAARPETNREKLRDILLDALEERTP